MNYWVVPLVRTARLVVTIHDVLFQAGPDLISRTARAYAWIMIRLALRRANRIITVSRFVRQEIIRFWPEVAAKIVAVPSGVGKQFQPMRDAATLADLRARYELPPSFLLYVGTTKRHKNLSTLIKAYALLPHALRIRYALVLVCKEDPRTAEIADLISALGLNSQVLWRCVVRDQDLPGLYSLATAFVLPSLSEGFGLPILEAMACGTPTLAARVAALPEVGGDASFYVDPTEPPDMAESLRRLLEDPDLREELSERGLARAEQFTWEQTAKAVKTVYDEALAQVPAR
jgi:glycosyltransferase involved in cell wall biosynthesis